MTLNESFSPEITEVFKKNVKKGDIVVDVGAHIGYFTIILSEIVGNDGKVIAFEPNPITYSILKKNIETNNLTNVILEQLALSNIKSEEYLSMSDLSAGTSIHKTHPDGVKVKTTTLDEYFKDTKINFLKIDVQGSEYNVLCGGNKVFSKKPKCIIEIHPIIFDNNGNTIHSKQVIEILTKLKYEIFNLTKREPLGKEEIIRADLFCH